MPTLQKPRRRPPILGTVRDYLADQTVLSHTLRACIGCGKFGKLAAWIFPLNAPAIPSQLKCANPPLLQLPEPIGRLRSVQGTVTHSPQCTLFAVQPFSRSWLSERLHFLHRSSPWLSAWLAAAEQLHCVAAGGSSLNSSSGTGTEIYFLRFAGLVP